MEANGGGYNNFNGTTGTKTNYNPLNVDLLARTPGQHIGIDSTVYNFSGQGDTIPYSGVEYCNGNNNATGDEGCKLLSAQVFAGLDPVLGTFTGTVTAINGNTLTITPSAGSNLLGEQQPLISTSRGVYTTGTASISGTPPTITGSGTSWTTICPVGATSNVFFQFTGETGVVVLPASSCTSDTSIALALSAEGANVSYNGTTTSGNYKLYGHGSIITAVPYTSGSFSTVYATVADPSQFQVGDSVFQPGAPQTSLFGFAVNVHQNIPYNGNSGSNMFSGLSNGLYPVLDGAVIQGKFADAAFFGSWVNYTTPTYGERLQGAQPGVSFYYANDTANNNTERLLGTANSSGSNHYLTYDRTSAFNEWGLDALSVGANGVGIGNTIHNSASTILYKFVSSGNSPTFTVDRNTYAANPNSNVWMSYTDVPTGKLEGLQSQGSGTATKKYGLGTGVSFYSDNMSTQTAGINGATGTGSFQKLNQIASNNFAGSCAMSSSTSCTFTVLASYTGTPLCLTTPQGTSALAGACSVSGTTVTITAASSNSQTWGAMLVGNPN